MLSRSVAGTEREGLAGGNQPMVRACRVQAIKIETSQGTSIMTCPFMSILLGHAPQSAVSERQGCGPDPGRIFESRPVRSHSTPWIRKFDHRLANASVHVLVERSYGQLLGQVNLIGDRASRFSEIAPTALCAAVAMISLVPLHNT